MNVWFSVTLTHWDLCSCFVVRQTWLEWAGMGPLSGWLGSSHLVLVGWVEVVPGFWVVLLVPEAANMEGFRAYEIKREEGTKRDCRWDGERHIGRKRTASQKKHGGSEGHGQNEIKCINVWNKDRWLWDEVNSAQRLGSAPLFIKQRLDFTELGWWPSIPQPSGRTLWRQSKNTERESEPWHGGHVTPPLSLHYHGRRTRESETEEAWAQHNSPAGDEVRHYSWPSQQPLLLRPK